MKKRVLSGITATGKLTIANYIGAIKNFIKLQDEYDMYIFIANLHAITTPIDPNKLKENTIEMACLYVACGLDPKKCNLFVQSDVPEHIELAYILLCLSNLGELSRMTQFKDKSVKQSNNTEMVPSGILTYPTLMASDILIYKPHLIPVGSDQKQHLELAKTLANRFNNRYGKTFFEFDNLIPKVGAKIMSLVDPTKKMSKSDSNENSFIGLLDSEENIKRKIKIAFTDGENKVIFDVKNKPGISNLLVIYSSFSDESIDTITSKYSNLGYKEFKEDLGNIIFTKLSIIQNKYNELIKTKEIFAILNEGANKAQSFAKNTLEEVKNKIGLNFQPSLIMVKIHKNKIINKISYNPNRWLILIDLDKTTLRNDGISIHPYNIQVIKKLIKMGHQVSIATGRPPRASEKFYWLLGMDNYMGSYNGAIVFNPTNHEEEVLHAGINKEIAKKIITSETMLKHSRSILLEINNKPYITSLTQSLYSECHLQEATYGASFFNPKTFEITSDPTAIIIETYSRIPIEVYEKELNKWTDYITYRIWPKDGTKYSVLLDIGNIKATKAECGKFLSKIYDIPHSKTMCFGDGANDFEMLDWAHHPVRMLEHSDKLARFNKYQTKYSNSEAGVGRYLNQFFKLKIKFSEKIKF